MKNVLNLRQGLNEVRQSNFWKLTLAIMICFSVLLIVASCGGGGGSSSSSPSVSSSALIGDWVDSNGGEVIIASSSIGIYENNPSCTAQGAWQLNGSKLDFTVTSSSCSDISTGNKETTVAVSGDTMTWTNSSGSSDSFQRRITGACVVTGCGIYGCVSDCYTKTQAECQALSNPSGGVTVSFSSGQTCP